MSLAMAVFAAAHLCGCAGSSSAPTAPAEQAFATPEAAVDSFIGAIRAGREDEIKKLLGPDSDEVISSGDKVADANSRAEFLRLYDERHSLVPATDGALTLSVGNTDWPLPIPLVKDDDGWRFDLAAGKDELLNRRIGRNELDAIQVCLAIVDAQREFAAADYEGDGWREYAMQFKSDPGKKNGLYWPKKEGEPESPLGEFAAKASGEGYRSGAADAPSPYHGYLYRILTEQGEAAPGGKMSFVVKGHMIGGFGVIAWPADYANSGLKTFITSHHGVVYERDLGDDTARIAKGIKAFNPEAGWTKCGEATN